MSELIQNENWASGDAYEPYMGRWSRLAAREFLKWLEVPPGVSWLDVGCGTGALTQAILEKASPKSVLGIDPSEGYLALASKQIQDTRAAFLLGDAQALPVESYAYDTAVSALVLNFVPHPDQALSEMTRVVRNGGIVAIYVWDYASQMQLIRYFWDAAAAIDPSASTLDEGKRFPICQPEYLRKLFLTAQLAEVTVDAIEVPTTFRDFDDYWTPFLGGQGPAPGYAMSLTEEQRAVLRERLRATIPIEPDGSLHLTARAWSIRGTRTV